MAKNMNYKLIAIPAFINNYIWLLINSSSQSIIIDPGESKLVVDYFNENNITPTTILLTHLHDDHINGVTELLVSYPHLLVYGPKEVADKLTQLPIIIVDNDDIIPALSLDISVISAPGHTSGHLCFYTKPYLFCGDVLFSAGCGRVAEDNYQNMFNSINKLKLLPNDTLICCAHEYTLSNLQFALSIFPDDEKILKQLKYVNALRTNNVITLPTTLKQEKEINIFLNCDPIRTEQLKKQFNISSDYSIFKKLRIMKNQF